MGENSAISWTDHTFNPWWGCTKISPACDHCYAATFAHRHGTQWGPFARRKFFGEKHWREPLKWNAAAEREGVRKRVFCASMADVFELLPDGHLDLGTMETARMHVMRLIEKTPHLDWLLLTKRPENVRGMVFLEWLRDGRWPANAWIGATAENQEQADKRIPELLRIPARVRFLSMEPLLSPVDLRLKPERTCTCLGSCRGRSGLGRGYGCALDQDRSIHWIIAGGESGHGARPSHPDWFRSLRDQCVAAGVPFHFKQWGDLLPVESLGSVRFTNVGKKQAGRELDGRIWDQFPRPVS